MLSLSTLLAVVLGLLALIGLLVLVIVLVVHGPTGMARVRGGPGDRWSMERVREALVDSARSAGRPGMIWVAGFAYPAIEWILGVVFHLFSTVPAMVFEGRSVEDTLGTGSAKAKLMEQELWPADLRDGAMVAAPVLLFVVLPIVLLFWRLSAGLAHVAEPDTWSARSPGTNERGVAAPPPLRVAWESGRGLTWSALGLVLTQVCIFVTATALLAGPIVLVLTLLGSSGESAALAAALMVPVGALLIVLALTLQVLVQLSLQSLVRNRRGLGSALIHGWRLMRNDPWATVRATLGDVLLAAVVLVLGVAIDAATAILAVATCVTIVGPFLAILAGILTAIGLSCIAGVTRAGYWARAYRELGGLAAADGVPGLPAEARPATG